MIVRMTGRWTRSTNFQKTMEYGVTEEGFYYLKRGEVALDERAPYVMIVNEFELNPPEDSYVLEVLIGTSMMDHTKGPTPHRYVEGRP